MGVRAWTRYTAEERYDYELQIRNLKICMPIVAVIAFVIGLLVGLVL